LLLAQSVLCGKLLICGSKIRQSSTPGGKPQLATPPERDIKGEARVI
jgi:hypothetical protein